MQLYISYMRQCRLFGSAIRASSGILADSGNQTVRFRIVPVITYVIMNGISGSSLSHVTFLFSQNRSHIKRFGVWVCRVWACAVRERKLALFLSRSTGVPDLLRPEYRSTGSS